jgi:hypothetical protein
MELLLIKRYAAARNALIPEEFQCFFDKLFVILEMAGMPIPIFFFIFVELQR